MPNIRTLLCIGLTLFLSTHTHAQAEAADDRVALALTGFDCPAVLPSITAALQQHTGVLQVASDLMPGHVLIDIVRTHVTEETLVFIATHASPGSQCRAEIMKSCITAEAPAIVPIRPSQPADTPARTEN